MVSSLWIGAQCINPLRGYAGCVMLHRTIFADHGLGASMGTGENIDGVDSEHDATTKAEPWENTYSTFQ